MIDLTSTPIVLMIILGVAGMIIPVINVARKEKGSASFLWCNCIWCINSFNGICCLSILY